MEKIWEVNQNYQQSIEPSKYDRSPLLKKVLAARQYNTSEAIEQLLTDQPLDDPFKMAGMTTAVQRINRAIEEEEPILVYGDYDADGVTSVAIMMHVLTQLGAIVDFYIPNRFTEGYGPNHNVFQYAADEGVKLIITVDNGVQGHDEINAVTERGVDVILTDHHEIGETLPDALVVIHPEHPDGAYTTPYLAGAGVSLKLASALYGKTDDTMLALAAIGTVSDLVPLLQENRTIVKLGLNALQNNALIGVKALLEVSGFNGEINEEVIGFTIGPRLNAVGRLDDARPAAELLMETDLEEARFLAEQIDSFNSERKDIVASITEAALEIAAEKVENGHSFLVISGEDWNEGVLGIVASKVVEKYYLPVIILNLDYDKGTAKGSARSVEEVSMYDALDMNRSLLSKFGGHHMAAGLTLPIHQVDELDLSLNEWLDAQKLELIPKIHLDAIVSFEEITVDHIKALNLLRPFGTGNPVPKFEIKQVMLSDIRTIGSNQNHLKLKVNESWHALRWSAGHMAASIPEGTTADICGILSLNEWNGNVSPQLMLEDIHIKNLRILDYRNQHPQKYAFLKNENVVFLVNEKKEGNDSNYIKYGDNIASHDKIVLRDLPENLEHFKHSLTTSTAKEIYVIFHTAKQLYFEGMPSLDKFRQLYKYLYQQPISLVDQGMELSSSLNVSPDTLMFMMKVMTELNLIIYQDEKFHLDKSSGKVEIPHSKVYQARQTRLKNEQLLLYSSTDMLETFIKEYLLET